MTDIKNKIVYKTMNAIVTVDKDGNEGVMGQQIGDAWYPFIFGDEAMIKKVLPLAMEIQNNTVLILKYCNSRTGKM